MSDNTSTKIESAKRNIEVAMDGITGALAEAFGDEISGVADWVARNRAPLMQFFLDVINGAIDAGKGFADFSASALESIGQLFAGLAKFRRSSTKTCVTPSRRPRMVPTRQRRRSAPRSRPRSARPKARSTIGPVLSTEGAGA